MAGRTRKTGARQPNGDLRRSTKPTIASISGALWQRILRDQDDCSLDPRGVYEIGRLARIGELTQAQAQAAHRVAEIYGAYERVIGLSRGAKGFSYEVGWAAYGISEDLLTPEQIAERERREIVARDRWKELQGELTKLPRALRGAIETLCIEDAHVLPVYLDEIRLFLNRLAVAWKITNKKRPSGHVVSRAARTSVTHPEQGEAAPARPKPNVDRIAALKFIRALRPDLEGDDLQDAYELCRALRAQTSHRFKTDRLREKRGKGPAYLPPAAEISTPITNRPVLALPEQQERA